MARGRLQNAPTRSVRPRDAATSSLADIGARMPQLARHHRAGVVIADALGRRDTVHPSLEPYVSTSSQGPSKRDGVILTPKALVGKGQPCACYGARRLGHLPQAHLQGWPSAPHTATVSPPVP